MNEAKLTTLEPLRQFLAGTAAVAFKPGPDDTRYAYIADVLRRFQYAGLKRPEKDLVLRNLKRTTGYSRQPLTRWVTRFQAFRQIKKHYRSPKVGFARIYPEADVVLLAETDALHSTLPSKWNDLIAVVGGLALYVAFVLWLHTWLIGVSPIGR